ncbi:MAG: hypothetical protein KJ638_03485 [Chloroflexi bacterium]|nr:hypothetical protein [Chloroflexota bacterium]
MIDRVNTLKAFAGILAGFFAILFVIATVLAFALYNIEQSAFDTDLYKHALTEEKIYQRLPELTAQGLAIAGQRSENGMLSLFRNLSDEEWRRFVLELLPPYVLRTLAEDAITQVIAYLNGESDVAVLSLATFKTYLQSPEGINALYEMLKAQPDCTLEQLSAMAFNQQALTLCSPPDTFLVFDLRPIVEAEIKAAVSLVPEQVTLISVNSAKPRDLRNLNNLRLAMRLSPLLPILCLLLITALVVHSFKDWLNWWGYPVLFAGLISMSLSAVSRPLAAGTFQVFIAPALPETLPTEIVDMFKDLTATIVYNAVKPTLLVAGIMALVGLIMVGIAFLLRKRIQKKPAYKS